MSRRKTVLDGRVAPSPNEEVLLYQSHARHLAARRNTPHECRPVPNFAKRIETFILKAAREGKTHSSLVSPNEAHENALQKFCGGYCRSLR